MKVGDYVEVTLGVHDPAMPSKRRDGLDVELLGKYTRAGQDQALIMFSNGAFLKFHVSQLVKLHKT